MRSSTQTPLSALPARLLLIDDRPIILIGLKQVIGQDRHLKVIADARSDPDGIAWASQNPVDLILLEVKMASLGGLETLQKLRANNTPARIVMFSASADAEDVVNALKNGADGYLLQDIAPEELLDKLHRVLAGELVLSDALPPLLIARLRQSRSRLSASQPMLTTRERDILHLVMRGLTNKAIARQLGIAENTVKVHMKHLMKKLACKTRVEAAVWALTHHLR